MYGGQSANPSRSPARFRAATAIERPNPMDVRLLALAELGCGRVAHSYDLWLYLRGEGLLDENQFYRLCEAARKNDQSAIPLRCR